MKQREDFGSPISKSDRHMQPLINTIRASTILQIFSCHFYITPNVIIIIITIIIIIIIIIIANIIIITIVIIILAFLFLLPLLPLLSSWFQLKQHWQQEQQQHHHPYYYHQLHPQQEQHLRQHHHPLLQLLHLPIVVNAAAISIEWMAIDRIKYFMTTECDHANCEEGH